IPNSQFATLKVYDMLGREVAMLVNEEKAPGNYEAQFDGSNISSGVYFYRLQAGSFSQTKKFVLLK
ncbi:MAG: T9SS type A sorting domain-containing protein, partial [Bacteroidetes bacterium]|nr:T9SS type A sorting domain-containing protein [Bacteroidota bacterium]